MKCRFCNTELNYEFIDLVNAPASNSFLSPEELNEPEIYYPLKLYLCHNCFLVQIDEYKKSDDIFNNKYIYFSSFSRSWVDHAHRYVDMITERLKLTADSFVIEIAANDGYLLQFFKNKHVPCLGIEPSANTAEVARGKGIEMMERFFGVQLAQELQEKNISADLILGNNVLAHTPYINDFVAGLAVSLKPGGTVTLEFPHLLQLIEQNQFDTIYHEHFSYFSFTTVNRIFAKHQLVLYDVEEIPTHGGSLRIFAKHQSNDKLPISQRVNGLLNKEITRGLNRLEYYQGFSSRVDRVKNDLLQFLLEQKKQNKNVVAYGAAAKGNTLLNYCGIKKDLIRYVVDASPHKQGKFLPGSHIPVVGEEQIKKTKPEFVVIFPWNIKEEIMHQLNYVRDWGARFVIPIPQLSIN